MVRVRLNEFVPVKKGESPNEVVIEEQFPFLAELDRQALLYLEEQTRAEGRKRKAWSWFVRASLWDVDTFDFMSKTDIANLTTVLGTRATQGWQNSTRGNGTVIANTMAAMAGTKRICGFDGAVKAIEKKDGKKHADMFKDACTSKTRGNIRPEDLHLAGPMVAAIRHAEGGPLGYEYGAGGKRGYNNQAGSAAKTVQNMMDRWRAGTPPPDWGPYGRWPVDPHPGGVAGPGNMEEFIEWAGKIYCEPGNDTDIPCHCDHVDPRCDCNPYYNGCECERETTHGVNIHWPANVWDHFKKIYYCEPV